MVDKRLLNTLLHFLLEPLCKKKTSINSTWSFKSRRIISSTKLNIEFLTGSGNSIPSGTLFNTKSTIWTVSSRSTVTGEGELPKIFVAVSAVKVGFDGSTADGDQPGGG